MIVDLLNTFKTADSVFIPGSSAEPRTLTQAIADNSQQLPAIDITHSFVPGINTLPLATPDNKISETGFFPRSGPLRHSSRLQFLPLSYYGARNYLYQQQFDWVMAHVSPPDNQGRCSLGVAVEFMPTVLAKAKGVIGIINKQMPYLPGSPSIQIDQFKVTLEIDSPLITYDIGEIDQTSEKIAGHVQNLVESGSVLQVGLGKVPDKLVSSLTHLKNLKFHSGMISDGLLTLANSGSLDPDFTHIGACALGSQSFYTSLKDIPSVSFCGVEQTHNPVKLFGYDNLLAINSALEVDLWGQANLEMLGTKQISNVGGAADFSRAARVAINGKSIVALPATAAKGKISRIVPSLQRGQIVSLGRTDIDYVVTEFGIAELKNKTVLQKGEALINIAAPEFRDQLTNDWKKLLGNS